MFNNKPTDVIGRANRYKSPWVLYEYGLVNMKIQIVVHLLCTPKYVLSHNYKMNDFVHQMCAMRYFSLILNSLKGVESSRAFGWGILSVGP